MPKILDHGKRTEEAENSKDAFESSQETCEGLSDTKLIKVVPLLFRE
jgi:hypothetical protein